MFVKLVIEYTEKCNYNRRYKNINLIEKREYIMENLINKVLEFGMGGVIDKSRDPLLVNDEVYKQDCADLADLEERYEALDLDKHDRMIINDYIACMNSSMCRANDISYFAGVRDTLSFLIQAGLLKQSEK